MGLREPLSLLCTGQTIGMQGGVGGILDQTLRTGTHWRAHRGVQPAGEEMQNHTLLRWLTEPGVLRRRCVGGLGI